MKKSAKPLLPILCLLLLLAEPGLAVQGASQGLALWGSVVLPTLLPFMLCTGVIAALDGVELLTRPVSPLLRRALGLSPAGSFTLVSGLLCGYPMGAKTCSDFLREGRLSPREAQILLAVCNQPSPMFLMGYVMGRLRLSGWPEGTAPLLLLSIYLPLIPLALLSRRRWSPANEGPSPLPLSPAAPFSFDNHMMSCFEAMVKIGGYIMLFSMAARYADSLPWGFPALKAAFLGFLEITTGIQAISQSVPGPAGLCLTAAAAAFGGLSGIFQTKSVLTCPLLSIRRYALYKLLHSALSAGLMFLFLHLAGL